MGFVWHSTLLSTTHNQKNINKKHCKHTENNNFGLFQSAMYMIWENRERAFSICSAQTAENHLDHNAGGLRSASWMVFGVDSFPLPRCHKWQTLLQMLISTPLMNNILQCISKKGKNITFQLFDQNLCSGPVLTEQRKAALRDFLACYSAISGWKNSTRPRKKPSLCCNQGQSFERKTMFIWILEWSISKVSL